MNANKALIVLGALALILGFITYFALFSGPQYIQPSQTAQNNSQIATSSPQASSTASSTIASAASSSSPSSAGSGQPQTAYQSIFQPPYPAAWVEGQQQLGIMSAMLQENQLVLGVNIQMGPSGQCVPINLRLITDENGDMAAPTAPASTNFPLAPDGTCQGDANTAYNESVTFTVDPASAPFLISTGDSANTFFEVSTTTDGEMQVQVPQKQG
ncbi:MAG: hypothetical protein KGJ13_03290 [Patescibacteria group bacterium]|nr:hypothetical protein [Patescibacteria group bacterium]